jgi:hypothetical protein
VGRSLALVALLAATACTATETPPAPPLTLSPEPEGCEFQGILYTDEVDPATLSEMTLPAWLPPGMALDAAFGVAQPDGPRGDGIIEGVHYVDARCRRVEVYLLDEREHLDGERRVGPWVIVSDMHGCVLDGAGKSRCITYWTNVDQGLLMVRTKGMNSEHADRVALSVLED